VSAKPIVILPVPERERSMEALTQHETASAGPNGGLLNHEHKGEADMSRRAPQSEVITTSNVKLGLILGAAVVSVALVIGGLMWQSNNTKGDHDMLIKLEVEHSIGQKLDALNSKLDEIIKEQAHQGNIQAYAMGADSKGRTAKQ
jgi:hypothetical protein